MYMSECVWAFAQNSCHGTIVSQIILRKHVSNRPVKLGFGFIGSVLQMICNSMLSDTTLFSSNGSLIPKNVWCMGVILKINQLFYQVQFMRVDFIFLSNTPPFCNWTFYNSWVSVIQLMEESPLKSHIWNSLHIYLCWRRYLWSVYFKKSFKSFENWCFLPCYNSMAFHIQCSPSHLTIPETWKNSYFASFPYSPRCWKK